MYYYRCASLFPDFQLSTNYDQGWSQSFVESCPVLGMMLSNILMVFGLILQMTLQGMSSCSHFPDEKVQVQKKLRHLAEIQNQFYLI